MKLFKIGFFLCIFHIQYVQLDAYLDYKSPFHPTVSENGMVVSQNVDSSEIGAIISVSSTLSPGSDFVTSGAHAVFTFVGKKN